jgi:hypothetical protein
MKERVVAKLAVALACSFHLALGQVAAAGTSADEIVVEVPAKEATEHFLGGGHLIHSDAPEAQGLGWYVNLKIVVTPTGAVKSATPVSGSKEWYSEATALAMTWQYEPFKRGGTPTYATFPSYVSIVPPERRPDQRAPFPEIRDWSSVRITLRRTGCYGTCPSYKLTIFGDGTVLYAGDGYVQYCGEYRGRIATEVVRQLVNAFREADYFDLFDRYALNATDLPTYITAISFDDKTKSVLDYAGAKTGMPEVVASLENSIDRLAGPRVWAKGMSSHLECENSSIPRVTADVPNKIE